MEYARYLSIAHFDDYTRVEIKNPWDTTKLLQKYALVPRESKKVSSDFGGATVVRVPIERAVVYTSVHTSTVEMLGAVNNIVGVCEARFIDSDKVQERISKGIISDIGEATTPNVEKIINISTEAIFASPFKDAGYGAVEKLHIPIVEGADYMEQHPLGRAEWLKFYGLLFGQREKADSIYKVNSKRYLDLKRLASEAKHRPTVMAERRYGGQWHVPGGDSYNATLFADAGGDYIFADLKGSGSIPLSFETVLDKCIDSEIWILKYYKPSDLSYSDLASENEAYRNFGPFKNRKIYGCNTHNKSYYEDMPTHPHLI